MKNYVQSEPIAPDGGWGWMVAVGTAMIFVTVIGPLSCVGLIFGDFLASLPEGTGSITTISGISCACSFFTGFATNQAFKSFSCRQVGLFGGILYCISSSLLAFVNNFLQMLSLSCVSGIGMGFITTAAFTSFNLYFVRRRNFVMGITQTLIGMGLMIYPILAQLLMDSFGFRGAQIIISAIAMHAVLGAVIMKPVKSHIKFSPTLSLSYTDINLNNIHSPDFELNAYDIKPEIRIELLIQDGSLEKYSREESIYEEQNITGLCTDMTNTSKGSSIDISNINLYEENDKFTTEQTLHECLPKNKMNATNGLSISQELLTNTNEEGSSNVSLSNCTSNERDLQEKLPLLMLKEKPEGLFPASLELDNNRRPSSQVSSVSVYFSMPRTSITTLESIVQGISGNNHPGKLDVVGTKKLQHRRWWTAVVDFLDLSLLQNPSYINTTLGLALVFYSDITFSALMPVILVSLGFSSRQAAICMSVSATTDLLGRLTYALFGLCLTIKNRIIFLFAAICTILFRTLFAHFNSYIILAILSGLLGFFRSFINVCLPMVVAESCTMDRFPAAYGLYGIIVGIINLLAGPLIGLIRDITDSYTICIHTLSAIMLVCILPWLLEMSVHWHQMWKFKPKFDMRICDNGVKAHTT